MPDCVFCRIAAHEIPSGIVYEDDDLVAFNDLAPQSPVHILVIPKAHIASTNDLTDSNVDIVGRMVLRAQALAAQRGIDESGYRLVVNCNGEGGQTVYHLHLHLLGGRQLGALG